MSIGVAECTPAGAHRSAAIVAQCGQADSKRRHVVVEAVRCHQQAQAQCLQAGQALRQQQRQMITHLWIEHKLLTDRLEPSV